MKYSKPLSEVVEQVCEYMYQLSIPDQTDILKNTFGIEVEDTDEGVLWEGVLISDSQFDSHFMDLIENMGVDSIIEVWSNYVNAICELDEENNVIWEIEE